MPKKIAFIGLKITFQVLSLSFLTFFYSGFPIFSAEELPWNYEDFIVDEDWPLIPLLEQVPLRYLADEKIITGDVDGLAYPFGAINRAQFVKILLLAADGEIRKSCQENPSNNIFPDIPDFAWYAPYVCEAKSRGIVEGYPDGNFHPDDFVSQAAGSKLIVKTFFPSFQSANDVPWFRPYMEKLFAENLIPSRIINYGTFEQGFDLSEIAEIVYTIKTGKVSEIIEPTTFTEFEKIQAERQK